MNALEQMKKMKESGLFGELKKAGIVPPDADLDSILAGTGKKGTEKLVAEENGDNYWAWGSKGCWHKPP